MKNKDIRSAFVTLAQSMSTQAQVVSTQAQAMSTQENRDVGTCVKENANITASRLRDFTRMNPPMFYGSKKNEDPQDFIDKVYKILYAMGLTLNEKVELASYQPKDVAQT